MLPTSNLNYSTFISGPHNHDIGPVYDLNQNDVLCGRGGRVNGHEGNVQFRRICGEKKHVYMDNKTTKAQKNALALGVVMQIRSMNPPGRFLKQDTTTKHWYDISSDAAMRKVGQAIREYQISKSRATMREQRCNTSYETVERPCSGISLTGSLYPGYCKLEFPSNKDKEGTSRFIDATKNNESVVQANFDIPLSLDDRNEISELPGEKIEQGSTLLRDAFLSFDDENWHLLPTREEEGPPMYKHAHLEEDIIAKGHAVDDTSEPVGLGLEQRWSSASHATMLSRQSLICTLSNGSSLRGNGINDSNFF